MTEFHRQEDSKVLTRYLISSRARDGEVIKEEEWRGPSDPRDWEIEQTKFSVDGFLSSGESDEAKRALEVLLGGPSA